MIVIRRFIHTQPQSEWSNIMSESKDTKETVTEENYEEVMKDKKANHRRDAWIGGLGVIVGAIAVPVVKIIGGYFNPDNTDFES